MLVDEVAEYGLDRICTKAKLVIWDLDDTFWKGTLSEGPIAIVPESIAAVKTLAERGIISAICSKNDYDAARIALTDCDAWDYFVFNKIDFSPKGARIASIIEEMNLRPQNVLFLDDNLVNLREVAFSVPGVMVAHPDAVLPALLDNPFLQGKPDPELKRLKQYRQLQTKVVEQSQTTLTNEEFLRSCGIRVKFVYELEPHVDRLIDLINRSNQLNYTKNRIDEADPGRFVALLRRRDVYAAAVSVADRYGDYGIVGFFLQIKDPLGPRLDQFVFSCRIMNMGVEQFVYDHLGRPPLDVAPPVAYPVLMFRDVDWIVTDDADEPIAVRASDDRLLLIGGCDLLQVASYCSSKRTEFVNDVRANMTIRYDDFGFVLNARDRLVGSSVLREIPCWTADEALALDAALETSDVLVISLWVALRGRYLATADQVAIRVHPHGLGECLDAGHRKRLHGKARVHTLGRAQNVALLQASISALIARSPRARARILLGANSRVIDPSVPQEDRDQRILYNEICSEFARTHAGIDYVAIDDLVPLNQMVDEWHYTRMGYLHVAEAVKRKIASSTAQTRPASDPPEIDVHEIVRQGRLTSSLAILGPDGYGNQRKIHIFKRLLKSNRLGRVLFNAAKVTLGKAPLSAARP